MSSDQPMAIRQPVFKSTGGSSPPDFFDNPEMFEFWNDDVPLQSSAASSSSDDKVSGQDNNTEVRKSEITEKKKERNRVLARETRQRKKFFYESLQKEVQDLVKENNHLKALAQSLEPSLARKIISECCSELPDIVKSVSNKESSSVLGRADFSLISAICSAQRSFCISDPALPDNPLVFASQGFLDLTEYSMAEILGRNCRFLQGPETDLAGIAVLSKGISEGVDTSVMLLNYKKDGTTFWNQIYCSALRDSDNNIVNYVGVQIEVLPSEVRESKKANLRAEMSSEYSTQKKAKTS